MGGQWLALIGYVSPTGGSPTYQLGTGPGTTIPIQVMNGGGPPSTPSGIVGDDSALWMAISATNSNGGNGNDVFDDPDFPNHASQFNNNPSNVDGGLARLGLDGSLQLAFAINNPWFSTAMPTAWSRTPPTCSRCSRAASRGATRRP